MRDLLNYRQIVSNQKVTIVNLQCRTKIVLEDIEAMPYPDADCFVKKQNNKVQKKGFAKTIYLSESAPTTFGDLLKAQGIALSSVLDDIDDK